MAKIKGFGVYGKNLNKMVKDLDTPILFIHSKLDSTVDYNVSINLSKKCKSYSDVILTEMGVIQHHLWHPLVLFLKK